MQQFRLLIVYSMILVVLLLPVQIYNAMPTAFEISKLSTSDDSNFPAYVPHSPIYIGDDKDFNGWPGEGTEDKPYIIEGLYIKSNYFCIKVVSTSSYFIIRDCFLENSDFLVDGTGIEMEKMSNGIIERCKINRMSTGISILKSQEVSVRFCQITKGKGGIRLEKVLSSEISGCELSEFDYGVYASRLDYSGIIGNIIEFTVNGIIGDSCTDTGIVKNKIQSADQGLSLYSSILLNITSNAIGDVRTGVYVKLTHNSSILDNNILNGNNGIFLESSNGNIVSFNNIGNIRNSALYVIYSWDTNFVRNDIADNEGLGVYLYDSANCVLYANYIGYNLGGNAFDYVGPVTKFSSNSWDDGLGTGNAWSGISSFKPYGVAGDRGSLDRYPVPILTTGNPSDLTVEAGSSNTLVWNASAVRPHYYLVEQDGTIFEEGIWDGNSITTDIISLDTGVYKFTLLVNTTDGKEMSSTIDVISMDSTPPEWIQTPEDRVLEHGVRLMITMKASDRYGISMYWVNDTSHFTIDDEGNLGDVDMLALGTYPIEVRAFDPSMNFISAEIVITVQDTIAPKIDGPGDIAYHEGDTGNVISWTISDGNPSSYMIYRNGDLIAEGGWTESFRILDLSVDGLSPGTYVYLLLLYDLVGNSATDEVTVIVNPKTTETTTETTPTDTTETTTSTLPASSPIPTEPTPANGTMLITGIGGIAALGVAAIILMMRKRK